jgi:hypothetical protein
MIKLLKREQFLDQVYILKLLNILKINITRLIKIIFNNNNKKIFQVILKLYFKICIQKTQRNLLILIRMLKSKESIASKNITKIFLN